VGFAAETSELKSKAKEKLKAKGLDLICANDVSDPSIGFDSDFNALRLFFKDGSEREISRMPKVQAGYMICEVIAEMLASR